MEKSNYNKPLTYAFLAAMFAVGILFLVFVIAILGLIFDGLKALVLHGEVNYAKLSLVVLAIGFIAGLNYVRQSWNDRRTFIAIFDKFEIVEPADRRDEAFEMNSI